MIKTHINKTRSVWKSLNENGIVDWNKLLTWKFWASCKKKIKTLITFIHIKELNNLLYAEKKLTSMIFRYVLCTDTTFEVFILFEIININFKTFYSLDFNSNEESLQYFRKTNVNHAWLTNNKIFEYKQYRFEYNLNEMEKTIKINRVELSIESIKTKIFIILSNHNLKQNLIALFFSSNA